MVKLMHAYQLDVKIDDGKPGTGIMTTHNSGDRLGNWGAPGGRCHDGNNLESASLQQSAEYYVTDTYAANVCQYRIKLN